ncbi:MAG: hypothetical protein M3Z08_17310 [Chloroflexota bacterium]|nr:hypothetical protein [Chloroflexota bacterium]
MGVQLCVLGGSACGTIGIVDGPVPGLWCYRWRGAGVWGCGNAGGEWGGVGQAVSVLVVWLLCGGNCGAAFLFQAYTVG